MHILAIEGAISCVQIVNAVMAEAYIATVWSGRGASPFEKSDDLFSHRL